MIHELKIWPEYFTAIIDGRKTFELRRNDRNYAVGDTLILREWEPSFAKHTGRSVSRKVTYIVTGGVFGLPSDLCVMALAALDAAKEDK